MAEADRERVKRRRPVGDAVRERLSVRHALEGQLVSLVNLLGRPLNDVEETRVGKVDDVVARWERNSAYPRVVAILARVGRGHAVVAADDITISQTGVQLRSDRQVVARPVRQKGDVALARDVLDHQLVDLAGVEVVRANDIYLFDGPNGWELTGVDVAVRAFLRRLGPRRRTCPPPVRAIDWAELRSRLCPVSPTKRCRTSPVQPTPPVRSAGRSSLASQLATSRSCEPRTSQASWPSWDEASRPRWLRWRRSQPPPRPFASLIRRSATLSWPS